MLIVKIFYILHILLIVPTYLEKWLYHSIFKNIMLNVQYKFTVLLQGSVKLISVSVSFLSHS